MTTDEFYENYRILYLAGNDESYVTVVKKINNETKQYVIPHEGRKIALDSPEYYQMPDWIQAKVNPLIAIDFNLTDNGN